MLAGAGTPGDLVGLISCSSGAIARTGGRVAGIADAKISTFDMHIHWSANRYEMDVNGFGGSLFPSSGRIGGEAFEVLLHNGYELQLAKPLTLLEYATYGLVADDTLCFFAVGAQNYEPLQPAFRNYFGYGDGFHQAGGDSDRLYRTDAGMHHVSGNKYALTITLRSVEDAFAEPARQSSHVIGTAEAELILDQDSFRTATLSGPAGFTGTASGARTGTYHAAAVMAFELTNAQGERIWGVLALDADMI